MRASTLITALAVVSILLLGGCRTAETPTTAYPRKPIKIIVPFDAGGGSDTFTRIIQRAIESEGLLQQPFVVINVPGASGAIGSRRVKNARPDGYTFLQLHEGILTSKYSGNVEFGPEAFVPVAATGGMAHVIAVKSDAPFRDIQGLVTAATERPDSILYAAGIGAPSHFAGLMLENAHPGAKFRFTQTGGGAKRFASLLGGHTQVTTFAVSEFVDFQSSGLRALAILTKERHPLAPEIPTAIEQGLDVVSTNMHFWWAPRGTPPDRIQFLADVLQRAMATPEVQAQLREMATDPLVLTGERLDQDLREREGRIASVSQRPTTSLPDFPRYVLITCLALGVAAFWPTTKGSNVQTAQATQASPTPQQRQTLLLLVVSTLAYVVLMQVEFLRFRPATFLYVLATGSMLSGRNSRLLFCVFLVAIGLSFGLHTLFTRLFVIDLP